MLYELRRHRKLNGHRTQLIGQHWQFECRKIVTIGTHLSAYNSAGIGCPLDQTTTHSSHRASGQQVCLLFTAVVNSTAILGNMALSIFGSLDPDERLFNPTCLSISSRVYNEGQVYSSVIDMCIIVGHLVDRSFVCPLPKVSLSCRCSEM
jgi:hypothetical protein